MWYFCNSHIINDVNRHVCLNSRASWIQSYDLLLTLAWKVKPLELSLGFLEGALAGMLVSHWLHLHPIDIVKTIIQSLTIGHRFLFHNLGSIMSERGMLLLKSNKLPVNFSFHLLGLMCCLVFFFFQLWLLGF